MRKNRVVAWRMVMLFLATWSMPAWAEDALPRVVSLNLCADQMVLALGAPKQIAGVSIHAYDAAISSYASEARTYPSVKGYAEEVLPLHPDVVIMSEGQQPMLRHWLERQAIRVYILREATTVDEVKRQWLEISAVLGRPAEGEAQVRMLDQALVDARARWPDRWRVMLYRPGGIEDGRQSALRDALEFIGAQAAKTASDSDSMHPVSLEEVVALAPELLVLEDYPYALPSRVEQLLEHPALARSGIHIAKLPADMLICPHHQLAEVVRRLAAAGASAALSVPTQGKPTS